MMAGRARLVGTLAGVVLLASLLVAASAGAVAQANNSSNVSDVAPYYANETTAVDNESWMAGRENATLDNTTNMVTRIGTVLVGTQASDVQAQAAGSLVTGLLVFAGVVGVTGGSRVGTTAGSVLGLATASGLVAAGLMPQWLYAVMLMILGVVASVVVIRAWR